MGTEMRGFVFAVVFIIVFSGLLATIPAGLQGVDETPLDLIPIDPSILTDFADGESYTESNFTELISDVFTYEYDLASRSWIVVVDATGSVPYIVLSAKILILGVLWLGHLDTVNFGEHGTTLTFADIDTDAEDGTARYTLRNAISGDNIGGFVAYWNTTTYNTSTQAWDGDELYLLHGVGLENTATNDIGALLIGLLFLQLPEVPFLVNLLLAVPVWASVVYVLWFVIKEMIPFLG